MPRFIDPNGIARWVPGVYSTIKVRRDLPGPLPEFHIPIMVADAEQGHPFDAQSSKEDDENDFPAFQLVVNSGDAAEYFGKDSQVGKAMRWAKRHGLPFCWVITASQLTRASVIATSGSTTVDETKFYPLKWGAPGGYIKLRSAAGTNLEITPLANYAMFTQNVGATDTRVYVKGNEWATEGKTLTLGDDATTAFTKVVKASGSHLDSNGQTVYWIDFTTAVGSALTTANYGLVCEYNEDAKEVTDTYAADIGQSIIDWVKDNSQVLGATAQGTFTSAALDALGTATAIKDIAAWGTASGGDSPAATSGRHDSLITAFDSSIWEDFMLRAQAVARTFYVSDETTTVQEAWRDWAKARRTAGEPVSMDFGCGWGDHVLNAGDSTDPIFRAASLNDQDCALWAGGLDREGANLSLAAAVWALRIAGGVGHNLTGDDLIYSEIERRWDERGSGELTALHKAGVGTYRLRKSAPYRYTVSQGLNTYQTNLVDWNESTATTPLIMQRDLADYVDRSFQEVMYDEQLGVDEVSPATIGASLNRRREQLEKAGRIRSGRITSIELDASGNGYNVGWSVRLPKTGDFIGGTTTIVIDDA